MDDTFYVINRGYDGKALTTAQRKSALFAEEPSVMGKVLRRGSPPLRLTPTEFEANKHRLLQLQTAGAIKITAPTTTEPVQEMTEEQRKLAQAALDKQRADDEAAALQALEADVIKMEQERLKAAEEKANEAPAEEAAPESEPAAEAVSEPEVSPAAVEPAAEAMAEVVPAKSDKKSSSRKGKG